MTKQKLVIVVVLAFLAAGCAAGRAFRRGEEAARSGDWDAYYERQYGSRLRSAG